MKQILIVVVLVLVTLTAQASADACVQCESSKDPRCATHPLQFMAKDCTNTTSKCYSRVENGNTIRGCVSDLNATIQASCNNELECLICTYMEGCNRNIFPVHRAQCLQCSGNGVNSSCALQYGAPPVICPLYKLGDKCFIRNTGKNATGSFQRGCLSSANDQNLCVKEENCYICEGVGCNFLKANDTQIPLAKDGAALLVCSLGMLIASIFITLHI